MKPNIFDYANKELSQDAFVTWLLNYADPARRDSSYTRDDRKLAECATKLLREMLFTHDITVDSKIRRVSAGTQKKGGDIWAEIELMDGKKYLIIIEYNSENMQYHDSLSRYRQAAVDYCMRNGFESPVCIYLKAGDEDKSVFDSAHSLGYAVLNRKTLILLMAQFGDIQNDIFQDFYARMSRLESALMKFEGQELEVV